MSRLYSHNSFPAIGAAAAALGGDLHEAGLINAPQTIHIRQGEAMARNMHIQNILDLQAIVAAISMVIFTSVLASSGINVDGTIDYYKACFSSTILLFRKI